MYKEIKRIYDETDLSVFSMASTHLMDIGWSTAEKITDENIENVEGNGLMTKEFCQELVRVARDIAKAGNPSEFIQLCEKEKLYDISNIEED